MRSRTPAVAVLLVVFSVMSTGASTVDDFDAWILNRGRIETIGQPGGESLPVGSLQKPFLVRAWARSHGSEPTPRFTCTRTSGCWRPSGHGTLNLRSALRESCNTYFRLLFRETPEAAARASFEEAGFAWTGRMTEAESIGLPGPAAIRVAADRLLASYVDLVRSPWALREDVRQEMILGLKDAADDGTAAGVRLWGFMAKTGTVPALDGAPLKTSGFAMVLDDAGFAFLGLLRRGTGREAAIRAGMEIAKLRPGLTVRSAAPPPSRTNPQPVSLKRSLAGPVRVEMLGELRLTEVRLKNVGGGPVDSSHGFVGPGAERVLEAGDRFSTGTWEIQSRKPAFMRRVSGSLDVVKTDASIRLIATVTARDYVDGILKAELGPGASDLRVSLASAALRYASRPSRHAAADVCDSTHCAWFVGEGPVPRWLRPDIAVQDKEMVRDLSDAEWDEALAGARESPEPGLWTADCGGDPLSPHFLWGNGDRRVTACPRHPRGSGKVWRREWPEADLAAVFGSKAQAIEVAIVDGQWMLRVGIASRPVSGRESVLVLTLDYDEAHRRLARTLGWDALPAPALRIVRTSNGFAAEGTGFGHRVGLCLGPSRPTR